MSPEALSVVTNAEYLAIFQNGRNSHRVSSILTQIYLLCGSERVAQAKSLIDPLYRAIYEDEQQTCHQVYD